MVIDANGAFSHANDYIARKGAEGAEQFKLNPAGDYDSLENLPPTIRALSHVRSLDIGNTQIADLRPLSALSGLEELLLRRTNVSDISPIAALPSLHSLDLSESSVADLRPILNMEKLGMADEGYGSDYGRNYGGLPSGGVSFAGSIACGEDAALARLAKIENDAIRTRETLAYLRSLPPWPEPYTPAARPDGKPPEPIGAGKPDQDPAARLIWGEKGFTFFANQVTDDAVAEDALEDLPALLDQLRRCGNRHDDLYRFVAELTERSDGPLSELNLVKLHLSFQKLRRVHDRRATRSEPFDGETEAVVENVLSLIPGVTLSDPEVRTLIERQEAENARTGVEAQDATARQVLADMQQDVSPFDPVVRDVAHAVADPNFKDRLSGTLQPLALNALIVAVSHVGMVTVDAAISGPVGNWVYDNGAALMAHATAIGGDVMIWARMVLTKFQVEYELAAGIAYEASRGAHPPGEMRKAPRKDD